MKENKKKSFFKSKLFLFVISFIFVIAIVSAAWVGFLSNVITWNVNVESPLELTSTIENFDRNTINVWDVSLTNNYDLPIETIVEVSIRATDEGDSVIGNEFETLDIGMIIDGVDATTCTDGTYSLYGDYFEDEYCYWNADYDRSFTGIVDGVYYVQMGDGSVPIAEGDTLEGKMKLMFSPEALGNFEIEVKAVTLAEAQTL